MFKRGRTETIRSCTQEAADLSAAVCALNYPLTQPMRDSYLYLLFTKALSKHKQLTQEAMAGQVCLLVPGFPNRLFVLFTTGRGATATFSVGALLRGLWV